MLGAAGSGKSTLLTAALRRIVLRLRALGARNYRLRHLELADYSVHQAETGFRITNLAEQVQYEYGLRQPGERLIFFLDEFSLFGSRERFEAFDLANNPDVRVVLTCRSDYLSATQALECLRFERREAPVLPLIYRINPLTLEQKRAYLASVCAPQQLPDGGSVAGLAARAAECASLLESWEALRRLSATVFGLKHSLQALAELQAESAPLSAFRVLRKYLP